MIWRNDKWRGRRAVLVAGRAFAGLASGAESVVFWTQKMPPKTEPSETGK